MRIVIFDSYFGKRLMTEIIQAQAITLSKSPVVAYLASLDSEQSRRTMRAALKNIIALMGTALRDGYELEYPFWQLEPNHTAMLRQRLIEAYAPATANRHLSALRGVLKECWRLGLMDVEVYQRCADLKNIKNETLPAGRNLPAEELLLLLKNCENDGVQGIRDLAVIAILSTTGVRREELAKAEIGAFNPSDGSLRIQGKRKKERIVYIVNRTRGYLDAWLGMRQSWVEEHGEAAPLLMSVRKGGHITGKKLTATAIYNIITARAKDVGLENLTPHDFRRTFVGNLLDKGVDMSTASKLTGHSSLDMVKRYDRRSERTKREAISKLDLPE
jgi:site-specific recombinase XerD